MNFIFSKLYKKATICTLLFAFLLFILTACGTDGGGSDPISNLIHNGSDPVTSSNDHTLDQPNVPNSDAKLIERDNTPVILSPSADGEKKEEQGKVIFDFSNTTDGYVMVKYSGDNPLVRVKIKTPDGIEYDYAINHYKEYITFPLTGGNGSYDISIWESVDVDQGKYMKIFFSTFDVLIPDTIPEQFAPYLRPNTYVDFNENSLAVAKAQELTAGIKSETPDIDAIKRIYDFVGNHKNIAYDTDKVDTMTWPYFPNIDETLTSKKGICFDYASLMASMLRSQGIPTKVIFGYVSDGDGKAYHAWISCWTRELGWIENIIYFDGVDWAMADPTFAASGNNSKELRKFIGDGNNYDPKFSY